MTSNAKYRPVIHAVALFAAAFTLPLLYVGGSVTTFRVGMAVPDWPTTFQENMFLYNFWNAPFGVQVEHVHRLYGAAVGMATIVLMVCLLAFDPRRWMKGLGVLALVAVIGQGVLGGLRVNRVSTVLAAVHGCVGQAFFGFLVALCVFEGRDWNRAEPRTEDPGRLRLFSTLTLVLVYGQVLAGGWLRHFATSTVLYLHTAMALAVVVFSVWLAWTIHRVRSESPWVVVPSRFLAAGVGLQVVLGVVSLLLLWPLDGTARPVPMVQAIVRTSHQTNAAILFAASIVLTLRAFRHHSGTSAVTHADADARLAEEDRSAGGHEPAALDWEAVA